MISAKIVRKQLALLKPFMDNMSLKTVRKAQNKIGELMELRYREQVVLKKHTFENFEGEWIVPKDERREGVILYLHGGGYVCGDLDYAAGFGSMLATQCGVRVFCVAYRLAPENPYPAALEDCLEAYKYLLSKGYTYVTICGESAGGGLCYALNLKIKEEGLMKPCAIIAISPWTDLTMSGESYIKNKDIDPSMTYEKLDFFANKYVKDKKDPMVSPIFGDLSDFPPSLIFVGGDEIMLSDSTTIHSKLLESGCKSELVVAKDRWHVYLLYGLKENSGDFDKINQFLGDYMSKEKKLRWLPLDNAAKLFPAVRNDNWSSVFRLSATLTEDIDKDIMQRALDITVRRFPSIMVRLRKGVFWYYLEQLSKTPELCEESCYPLTRMSAKETRKCAIRVIVYKKRIALEIFHSLTDGNGALVLLKSLVAEYIYQKYGVYIPSTDGVLGRLEKPFEEEFEDSFQKNAGNVMASRKENNAWHFYGTPTEKGFLNLTCFEFGVDDVLKKAHEYNVTLTGFICAAIMHALQNLQKEKVLDVNKRKPIRVMIPVNLRKMFKSKTLRNFAMYTTPEILPKLGEYSFEEICQIVKARMALDITPKQMRMKIATNVSSERIMAVRMMPLFVKNIVMKIVFGMVGERKNCLSLSNLGAVKLPEPMMDYVDRIDFILGVQATAPYNCGMVSFKDKLYINFIRDIKEPMLEYHFYKVIKELGLEPEVSSNAKGK